MKTYQITGIVLLLSLLLLVSCQPAGQAIYVGESPWAGGIIDLSREESVTFTVLPEEETEININTSISSFNDPVNRLDDPKSYQFILEPREEGGYIYRLHLLEDGQPRNEIARDVLSEGDTSTIYLNTEDVAPDLEISYPAGAVKITNLHYLPPDSASIILRNASNQVILPHIIRMNRNEILVASINATSSFQAPLIEVLATPAIYQRNISLSTPNYQGNQTLVALTFTTPQISEAIVLDVVATVGGQETHAYYTLAVGDLVYALRQVNFPEMKLKATATGATELEVTFAPTQSLQPFALPCALALTPPTASAPSTVFNHENVRAVYTYDTREGEPLAWRRGIPVSDIAAISPFVGYFVELARPQQTTITFACTPRSIYPLTAIPPPLTPPRTLRIDEGWTLFSLPGTVPRPLTDFTPAEDFRLFECRQGEVCEELDMEAFLYPGKPYWLYTDAPFTIGYRLE